MDNVTGVLHPAGGELGDMHQPFDPVLNLDESAEVHQPGDGAIHHVAHMVAFRNGVPGFRLGALEAQ